MKKIIGMMFLAAVSITAVAQSGTNSPYSQYGLGVLSEQSSGFNRGMNGLGLGFRDSRQVNFLNPASYSGMDSLMFLFDAGVSGQTTRFKERGRTLNANNADFEYAVAGFRAARHVGVSFGIVPFTNIGFNYSNTEYVDANRTTSYTNTYYGRGGMHCAYLGAGWMPVKGFSVGVNASYIWGNYSRSIINSYSDKTINTLSKFYTANVTSYQLGFGVQYTARLSKKDEMTLGATYSLGHDIGGDPTCRIISTNPQTSVSDTATYRANGGLSLPAMLGVGISWSHDNRWRIGADYSLQKWSSVDFPEYSVVNNVPKYALTSHLFKDRHKLTFGGEYCQDATARNFFRRLRYRAGVSYTTPYLKINGQDGPKETSVSAGFGIPIMNAYNNRSMLNISAQWVHSSATGLITENTFRINIGLTFNERWFQKWKVE